MLEPRPSCEHCDTPLPPASPEVRICSFECTFCAPSVDGVLRNVCSNCGGGGGGGGGGVPRPARPATNSKGDNWLGHDAADGLAGPGRRCRLRGRAARAGWRSADQLAHLKDGASAWAWACGIVTMRQQPETAKLVDMTPWLGALATYSRDFH